MKKFTIKLLTLLGLASLATTGAAQTYHEFATEGDSIVYTQVQTAPKLSEISWISNNSGTAYSATNKGLSVINPTTNKAAESTTVYAINVKSNDQKTIHAYVTGVDTVTAYFWPGGDGRLLNITATPTSGTAVTATAKAATSNTADTLSVRLDNTLSYDVKLTCAEGDVRLYALKFHAVSKGASVKAISFKGTAATISGTTITADLSGVIGTTGSVDLTSDVVSTLSDGATLKFYSDAACGTEITTATANVPFYAKAYDGTTNKIYTVSIISEVKTPVITLSTGSNAQSVKSGTAITDIVYDVDYAESVVCDGLPTGVTFDETTKTISGTPSVTEYKIYSYTITATGAEGADPKTATATGTINVYDPASKIVAYIYTGTIAPTGNDVYDALVAKKYIVTMVDGAKTLTGTAVETADLIVFDEAVGSSSTGAIELGTKIGVKPILNLKAHVYGKTNWPSGTGSNDGGVTATAGTVFTSHPLFTGITLTENKISIAETGGNVRGVTSVTPKSGTLREIATNDQNLPAIVEENNGTASDANKYLMIAMSAASESILTADGIKLIENAAEYLLGSTAFVPAKSTEKAITAFSIDGVNGTINEADKTISVVLPSELYTSLTAITPTITISNGAAVSPASATATDFSSPVTYTVTAEDESTQAYTVSVTTESVAIDAPYTTTIPASYVIPKGIIGNATLETAYAGNDASIWYETGETTTASVIRFEKNEKITLIVNNPGAVTIGMSATGGRTFNMYLDDNATAIATQAAGSNAKVELKADVYLTGAHKIIIENVGNGGATIGSIDITNANTAAVLSKLTVAGVEATINEEAKTATVEVGTDANLATLTMVATANTGATVTAPADMTSVDATSGTVTISVKSKDETVINNYTLTVTQAKPTGAKEAENEVKETYYISVDGKKFNATVNGLPLVKIDVMSDGSVKTKKVISAE